MHEKLLVYHNFEYMEDESKIHHCPQNLARVSIFLNAVVYLSLMPEIDILVHVLCDSLSYPKYISFLRKLKTVMVLTVKVVQF